MEIAHPRPLSVEEKVWIEEENEEKVAVSCLIWAGLFVI